MNTLLILLSLAVSAAPVVGLIYMAIKASPEHERPDCYGEHPDNPQHAAEWDCPNCPFHVACFRDTPGPWNA